MSRDEELIAAYLDDSLTEAETVELNDWLQADAEHVKRFVLASVREEQLRRAVISSTKLRAVTERQSQRSQVVSRKILSRTVLKYAAAIILTAVATWFLVPRADQRTQVSLIRTSGPVSLRKNPDSIVEPVKIDARIDAGTLVIGGMGTRAEFAFADGSTFELAGGSELTLGNGQGKQMLLRHGTLFASVAHQPARYPLRIQTPTAEAIVRGTSFALNAREAETFLRVESGAVELRRLADHQALTVSGLEQARAGVNVTQPMRPEPVTSLPDHWRANQKSLPMANWLGEWRTPEILRAVPRVVFVSELGVEERHYHAGAFGDFPGLVTLRSDSAVRVRYRIQRPLNLGLFISTHTETGEFSGNFQAYVEERKTPADAEGWRTATVPITSFMPIRVRPQPFQPNCVVEIIFATTFADDVGLELAKLEVVSKGDM